MALRLPEPRHPDVAARVLVYDIETTPNLGWVWGKYKQNVIAFEEPWYMLSFAYKWLGQKQTYVVSLPDFPLYAKDPRNDIEVVKALHELFSLADLTVTHNGKSFDNKKANARMAVHQLAPPPAYKEIDTLLVARRQFAFTSNRLGDLCRTLGLPHKEDPGGFKTWEGCMNGSPKAWATMRKYNKQDVVILEQLYLRLRPWMSNHPNLNIYGDRPDSCPRCGSEDLMRRGWRIANVYRYPRYQCNGCGGYCRGRTVDNTRVNYRSA